MTIITEADHAEFDREMQELVQHLSAGETQIALTAVQDLMRKVFWHDWPETFGAGEGEGEGAYKNFDHIRHDDAQFLERFVSSCVTFLESEGKRGLLGLKDTADTYLQHRGLRSRSSESAVVGDGGDEPVADGTADRPTWDRDLRELWCRGNLIRKLPAQTGLAALNVLSSFAEESWPERILNPIADDQKTKDAIRTINNGLKGLRFFKDGDCIRWREEKSP